MNLTITETAKGVRVHRENCSRVKGGKPLTAATVEALTEAKAATCCKPVGVGEALRTAIKEVTRAAAKPEAKPAKPEAKPAKKEPKATAKPEAKPADGEATATIAYDGRNIARHFFDAAVKGAKALAAEYGVKLRVDGNKKAVVLTGESDKVVPAARAIGDGWDRMHLTLADVKAEPWFKDAPKTGPDAHDTYVKVREQLTEAIVAEGVL